MLQHVSDYINHHQGALSLCFAKVTMLTSVTYRYTYAATKSTTSNKYEAYLESKYRFAVKKKLSKVSYKILLLSDNTFFKLFFRIFVAIIEAS